MVETVACPSCTKPIAVSVLKAGQKRCHHCGARLPEQAAARPPAVKAPADLPRPASAESDAGAGSSPYWQAPAQLNILRNKKGEVDSAGNMLPERPRSAPPAHSGEERPVLLKPVAKAAPAKPAAQAPTAAAREQMELNSLIDAVDKSSGRGLPSLKTAKPSRAVSAAGVPAVRPARGTNWAIPLGLALGFTVTLGLVILFLFLRGR
jgi:hypothetical protein